jgi:hypothetical protein
LRADADLIAHAMRVRLGLDSASAGGRFFAVAAPLALAVAAAYGGIQLMRWYAGIAISPGTTWSQFATIDVPQVLNLLLLVMMPVGAILALTGRWMPGRILAVAGLLGFAVQWAVTPGLYGDGPFEALAAMLTAATILACPPDLLGSPGIPGNRRNRRNLGNRRLAAVAGGMAAVAWFPLALVQTRAFVFSTDYGAWPLLTLALAGIALAIHARPFGLRELAATAAASPLFLAHAYATGILAIVR